MTNEELLQKVLNNTIERLGRQAVNYEAEIANLTSQVFILNSQVEEFLEAAKTKGKSSVTKDS
jgi:hypothetical protein